MTIDITIFYPLILRYYDIETAYLGAPKMSPPSLAKFDVEDGVKLVAIVALSDFTKDYLIKQKIIPNNI